MKTINVLQKLLMDYDNLSFEVIAKNIKYKATTNDALSTMLDTIFKTNRCKDIFYALKNE